MQSDAIKQALAGIREERAGLIKDRDKLADQAKALDAEIRKLTVAERALDPSVVPVRAPLGANTTSARQVMERLLTATQMQVAREMGKPKNTAKAALEKLEAEGVVVRTGKSTNKSPEFEFVAS